MPSENHRKKGYFGRSAHCFWVYYSYFESPSTGNLVVSMDSELHALQAAAHEMSSLDKVCGRILRSVRETERAEKLGVLFTDSESALKLLRNMDVPKRSRHLEIRIEWLKGRVSEKVLVLSLSKRGIKP